VISDFDRNTLYGASRYAVADGMAAASSSVNTVDFVISVGDNFYLRGVMDEFDLNWRYMLLGLIGDWLHS